MASWVLMHLFHDKTKNCMHFAEKTILCANIIRNPKKPQNTGHITSDHFKKIHFYFYFDLNKEEESCIKHRL